MIPGVSRSGATIMGARVFRVDRASGGGILVLPRHPDHDRRGGLRSLQELVDARLARRRADRARLRTAFVSALVVVRPFVRFISRHGFGVFAWYRIAVGALALGLLLMR